MQEITILELKCMAFKFRLSLCDSFKIWFRYICTFSKVFHLLSCSFAPWVTPPSPIQLPLSRKNTVAAVAKMYQIDAGSSLMSCQGWIRLRNVVMTTSRVVCVHALWATMQAVALPPRAMSFLASDIDIRAIAPLPLICINILQF